MRRLPVLSRVAALLGLALPATAQINLAEDPVTLVNEHELGLLVAGELTADGRPDAVTLTSSRRAILASSVAERQHRTVLGDQGVAATLSDLALQPRGAGFYDALLTANPNGVHQWRYDAPSESLRPTALLHGAFVKVAYPSSVTGDYCVGYALEDDHRTLRVLLFSVATGDLVLHLSSFVVQGSAYEIDAIDLDGDGMAEVALADATGLRVYNAYGTNLLNVPRSFPGDPGADRFTPLRDAGSIADQLAWTHEDAGGIVLEVVAASGVQAVLSLGSRSVRQLASADLDGDGLADLALAEEIGAETRTRVLQARAPGPRYPVGGPSTSFIGSTTGYGSGTGVAIADLDRDGDLDVVAAGGQILGLARGQAVDHASCTPIVRGGAVVKPAIPSAQPYTVDIELHAPAGPAPSGDLLRYRVWHRPDTWIVEVKRTLVLEETVAAPTVWPFHLETELFVNQGEAACWYVEIELVDTTTSPETVRPTVLAVAAVENLGLRLIEATPLAGLWGGPPAGGGGGQAGSGGVSEFPRIPPDDEAEPGEPGGTIVPD